MLLSLLLLFTLCSVLCQTDGEIGLRHLDDARLPHLDRSGDRPGDDALRPETRGDRLLIADAILQTENRWQRSGSHRRGQFVQHGRGVIALDCEHGEVKGRGAGKGLSLLGVERLMYRGNRADRADRMRRAIGRAQFQTARPHSRCRARAADQCHVVPCRGQLAADKTANGPGADNQDTKVAHLLVFNPGTPGLQIV